MKIIDSEIKIKANPSKVWRVLNNFVDYPQWNPFIVYVGGNVSENNRINVKIKPVGSSEMVFKPTVLRYIENQEITWRGKLFINGLFDGKHTFKLVENSDGSTTFIQSEIFSGI